jgi:hypothetical protein
MVIPVVVAIDGALAEPSDARRRVEDALAVASEAFREACGVSFAVKGYRIWHGPAEPMSIGDLLNTAEDSIPAEGNELVVLMSRALGGHGGTSCSSDVGVARYFGQHIAISDDAALGASDYLSEIMIHEIGHILGLWHFADEQSPMRTHYSGNPVIVIDSVMAKAASILLSPDRANDASLESMYSETKAPGCEYPSITYWRDESLDAMRSGRLDEARRAVAALVGIARRFEVDATLEVALLERATLGEPPRTTSMRIAPDEQPTSAAAAVTIRRATQLVFPSSQNASGARESLLDEEQWDAATLGEKIAACETVVRACDDLEFEGTRHIGVRDVGVFRQRATGIELSLVPPKSNRATGGNNEAGQSGACLVGCTEVEWAQWLKSRRPVPERAAARADLARFVNWVSGAEALEFAAHVGLDLPDGAELREWEARSIESWGVTGVGDQLWEWCHGSSSATGRPFDDLAVWCGDRPRTDHVSKVVPMQARVIGKRIGLRLVRRLRT